MRGAREGRIGDIKMLSITKEQAKRFILVKQGLLGKHVFCGKDGAYRYIRQAGCIQYDPVDVCGKNAELTLQSRVKGFTKQMLDDLLYKDRLLVDYTDKELSIWPSEDWPYFSAYRERSLSHGAQFEGLIALEEEALSYIRKHGAVSSDSLPIEGKIFWHSSMHWSGNWSGQSQAARSVLEQLYTDGVLLIHHKSGSRKFYDLAERHLPPSLLSKANPCEDEEALLNWRVARRVGAIGLLWNRRSDAFLGIEMSGEKREKAFEDLEKQGRILPVQVEGFRAPLYMLSEDRDLLDAVLSGAVDTKPRLEFLAPLDPMLWDRKLIKTLWDFEYSWEIYTPAEKRKYGYYVLPMLWGDKLISRIEAAADRKNGKLSVKNIWYEDGVKVTKKLTNAVDAALLRLARFNRLKEIERLGGRPV